MAETNQEQRYEMKMPSHRGNPGSSSSAAKNSNRPSPSLISHFHEKDRAASSEKENKVNISNMAKIHKQNRRRQQRKQKQQQQQQQQHRGQPPQTKKQPNKNKAVNLLPEMDQVRGIGVREGDATPQELYAIGAVFDHIYRGGSPMNCISVFQKEVNRAPPTRMFDCTGFRWGADMDVDDVDDDDDNTLQTMEWTYNGLDLSTLDENGTYARSFVSRDESLFSREKIPWDEGMTTRGTIGGTTLSTSRTKGKKLVDTQHMWSDMSGIKNRKGKKSPKRRVGKASSRRGDVDSHDDGVFSEADETIERLKAWSEIISSSAAARDHDDNDSYSAAAAAASPNLSCSAKDLVSLAHLFRKTLAGKSSRAEVQTALVRIFHGEGDDDEEEEDELYSTDESFESYAPRSLNSLAKAMQTIATKEPTRMYAASEQDQVAPTGKQVKVTPKKESLSNNTVESRLNYRGSDTVGATILSHETPPRGRKGETIISVPSPLQRKSTSSASVSGTVDREDIGSHRGDAASVSGQSRQKVPTSIRLPSSAESVLQDLFITPTRVSSSATAVPKSRSFFKRRETPNAGTPSSETSTIKAQIAPPLAKTASSPRRFLPPVAPTRSPTAPSPSRNLHLSSDNDGTEMSIVASPEDNHSVVTPPQSTGEGLSSVSPKSSSGISIKKRFSSFRKRKPKGDASTSNSPRSSMGIDSHLFQSSNDNNYSDDSVIARIAEDGENENISPLHFDGNETSTTNGLLLTQTNKVSSEEYEVQSV